MSKVELVFVICIIVLTYISGYSNGHYDGELKGRRESENGKISRKTD